MRGLLASILAATCLLGVPLELQAHSRPKPARKAPISNKTRPPRAAAPGKAKDKPSQPPEGASVLSSEPPEWKALQEAEREIFPERAPQAASPTLDTTALLLGPRPEVTASGAPAAPALQLEAIPEATPSLDWLKTLRLPDLPARMDERVIKYLRFFREDPRGRSTVALGWRRAGRYREQITAVLRAEKVPEALLWVAMTESGFDPGIKSHAGAVGLWQFMPEGARLYGLRVDRWMDERKDPTRSTVAAARYLKDLHRRFGSWELALAAYNMGFGGLLAAVRKYNTNDFWELCRYEAGIPWETTLYVPKILALAIVAENPGIFGLESITPDPPIATDLLRVPASTPLAAVAHAAGVEESTVAALNPQLPVRRTPPAPLTDYEVRVPSGKGAEASQKLGAALERSPKVQAITVRLGQTVASLASELGVSRASLAELNGLAYDENPQPGETLLIPAWGKPLVPSGEKPVVAVPRFPSAIPGRQRVFYRVVGGDTLEAIASVFRVHVDDLRSWNALDPSARLLEGTTLQIFLPPGQDLSGVVAFREEEVRILVVGSDEFFTWFEAQKGRRRLVVTVAEGETWQSLSRKYGLSLGLLERINRRSHTEPLRPGETVVVYTSKADTTPRSLNKADETI
ncbi:MAG: transglycosylase SLT domain-containing protein [Myxococcales bacterium]|nr:transglycosylase SLT domain-containing protein [Polyangiaceae bacterium]MDW8249375.1 transglycosylase SLT domain-containing protein [Myxococcales bacterium]